MMHLPALLFRHRHVSRAARLAVLLPLVLAPLVVTAKTKHKREPSEPAPQEQAVASEPTATPSRLRREDTLVRPAGAASSEFTIPLSRLKGDDKPVRLAGVASSMKLSLPLPALVQAQDVRLELSGTASRALMASSQLEVAVNGRVVRQFGLSGSEENFRHSLSIPLSALREGFNEVQISVAQHYASTCEYPMASQLWTDIHLRESQFVVSATPKALPARLDRLDALFDKAVFADPAPVSILTAKAPEGAVLSAAGLVAQGIGHRYDYVPVRLSTARFPAAPAQLGTTLPAQARAAVVLGTFDSLGAYLQGLGAPTDSGPVVAIRTLPEDPTRFVVILAAATEAELPIAATAFAMQRMPWPGKAWVAVRDLQLPPPKDLREAADVQDASTHAQPFSALGYATTTYSGLPTGNASLRFWNSNWQGRMQVRLHLAYGSGMSAQSALNVLANGVMHGSIPLNNPAGGVYTNYAVSLPTGSLRMGWNTLELQPVLVPQANGGECKPFFLGNLATTIYDDSTVQNFGGSPLLRPDLGLIARDGRGSPIPPLGEGMAVQLTDAQDPTVGAGLTLMAKLAQVLRTPLLRTSFQVGQDEKATNRLWVGTLERLPENVRERAGLNTAGKLLLNVPLMQSVRVPVIEGNDTLMQLRELIEGSAARPLVLGAAVALNDTPPQHAIATTVFDGNQPLTVFAAAHPDELQAALHHVVGYGPWGQLRGGMAFWRPGEPVKAVISEDTPFSAYALRGSIGLWVSQYPWWSLAIVLAMIASLVALTRTVLARYRQRNLPAQAQRTSGSKA